MNKSDVNKILKKAKKAEKKIMDGHSELSGLSSSIEHLFKEEIDVNWSTDGAVITNLDGEIDFLENFLNNL